MDGLAFDLNCICGISRFLFKPMMAVGEKAKLIKFVRGYQNQKFWNTSRPTAATILVFPVRVCREMVMLQPPASMIPQARMAPNLASISSCLSEMIFRHLSRNSADLGQETAFCCISTMAIAISAPWRTKWTVPSRSCSRREMASLFAVPAQAIPKAIAAP